MRDLFRARRSATGEAYSLFDIACHLTVNDNFRIVAAVGAIVVDSLHVVRGARLVLDGVSVTVPAGSVTGLLGPSGSGKTTLMRSIVGVQIVSSGRVTVLGRPAGSPELRARVGYVTQAPSVYADLTVRELVECR